MKKRIILYIVSVLLVMNLCACSSNKETTAPSIDTTTKKDNTSDNNTSDNKTPDNKTPETDSAEDTIDTYEVKISVPEEYFMDENDNFDIGFVFGDINQTQSYKYDLEQKKINGKYSTFVNIYMMNDYYKQVLEQIDDLANNSLEYLVGGEESEYVTEISHREDYKQAKVVVDSSTYVGMEQDSVPSMVSSLCCMYQAFTPEGEDTCTTTIVDENGKELGKVTYPPKMPELES